MRRLFALPLALLCLGWALWGLDLNTLRPTGYVNDFAGVVDPAQKQQLEAYLGQVEQATGAQFAVAVLPSLDGEPIEDLAADLYRKWGVGKKTSDEGLLLLLAVADRRSRIEVGYGLEAVVTDGYAGGLLREMRPYLRGQDYGGALTLAVRQLGTQVAQAKGVTLPAAPAPLQQPRDDTSGEESGFPWGMVIFFGLLLLTVRGFGGRRGRRGGAFFPPIFIGGGGWGSGSSRGGFGGYDAGGGFGGFGGGDSGGGGASSNW